MKIHIIDNHAFNSAKKNSEIKKLVRMILRHLTLPNKTEICISFIDDLSMKKLNKSYRNIDKKTDVLSFPQDKEFLGDLVISFPTAIKNADRYKINIEDELKRLVIHGILHLLGYDHKKKTEREVMRAKEKELMDIINHLEI